jgi:hypothetical protein
MDSGATQVIALFESCRAAYEQTLQHLSPAEREQVTRYWNSMNSDLRSSPSAQQYGTSVPSKRTASGAMFGDTEPTPKRTGRVCTLLFSSPALVDVREQGSLGFFGSRYPFPRTTHLSTRRSGDLAPATKSICCSDFASGADLSDNQAYAHPPPQQWATTRFRGRLLPQSVYWIQPPLH